MITFNNIVERFQIFADNHFFIKTFSFGSPDDVDLSKFTTFPLMHLVYTGATYDAGTKTYNLEVYILDVPADKSGKEIRQKEVVSDAEQCAEDIIADIKNGGNIFLFAQDYEVVNATTTPLEEETKNVLSGVLLDLSVAIPYEWDACNAPIDGVTPEGGEVTYARRGVLRMLTIDGATDVQSVRTIKVTNGTLTDDGDGTVTLDTGGAESLNDLNDVTITSLVPNQFLQYDGVSGVWENITIYLATLADTKGTPTEGKYLKYTGGFWQPADVAAALNDLSDVDTTGVSTNQVLLYNGTNWVDSNLPIVGSTGITNTVVGGASVLSIDTSQTFDIINATGDLVIKVDSDNNESGKALIVKDGLNAEVFRVSETGAVTFNQEYTFPLLDGSANQLLKTNGAGQIAFGANLFDLDNVAQSGGSIVTGSYLTWSGSQWTNTAPPSPPVVPDELNDLSDVSITTPVADEILRYTGSVWSNEALTQYHDRYASQASTLRSGATATTEIYYTAQADGDGYSESASSDTPTTGYDIQRKLYYSEAAQADPDTGTWTQFTAIADNTTFANAKAALLAYLKERTGGTVPISLKQTWEEVAQAPAFTGLLNESYGSGAATAYSTRRLNGNVTDCMVIRRASDSTTTTIGFDGSGNIDESAINTFCSGTTCTVQTWKDQSGNGNDATQATPANQPTIYTGGAIVKENGKPAVSFDGINDELTHSISGLVSGNFTYIDTFKSSDATAILHSSTTTNTKWIMIAQTSTSTQLSDGFNAAYDGYFKNGVQPLSSGATRTDFKNAFFDGGQNLAFYYGTTSSVAVTSMYIGRYQQSGFHFNGLVQESILYTSDKSTDRTSIESNVGDYFTQNTPLLDTYSGAAAAYSLRKLRTAYTGSAIRVRRASDNTESDINFNVFGELDTVSLASFCSGTNGFVKTWYDQSGNSNDATQTTTSAQPKIYDSVTGVVTENGKPAIYFSGAEYIDSPNINATISTVFGVHDNGGSTSNFIGMFDSGDNSFYYDQGTRMQIRPRGGTITTTTTAQIDFKSWYVLVNGSSSEAAVNDQTPVSGSTNTITFIRNRIGLRVTSSYFVGHFYEMVIYDSNESSNRSGINSNINTFYSIY